MKSMSDFIRQKAFELGFHKVGFAKAEQLNEKQNHLEEWIKKGFNGEMSWMGRNISKRINPSEVMPNAKSIVSVAMNYYNSLKQAESQDAAKIARYALKRDYHELIGDRLHQLLQEIKRIEPMAQGTICVDHGPVMEKAWAVKSGIGWQGKHTITISREFGSWILLGELILNLELDFDLPAIDLCGDCTLCIDACPTKAIVEPYVLDATKCISYLTIEYKGAITSDLSSKMDNWIFGCDVCQEVCPWNLRYSKLTNEVDFIPDENDNSINTFSMFTKNQFDEIFKNSPIKRIGYDRFKRNVQYVLTNIKGKENE